MSGAAIKEAVRDRLRANIESDVDILYGYDQVVASKRFITISDITVESELVTLGDAYDNDWTLTLLVGSNSALKDPEAASEQVWGTVGRVGQLLDTWHPVREIEGLLSFERVSVETVEAWEDDTQWGGEVVQLGYLIRTRTTGGL